jgi:ATP-dependent protease ClpP protease subunit
MKLLAILAALFNVSYAQSTAIIPKYSINLNADNNVVFRGEVNQASVSKAEAEITALVVKRGSKNYPIYLTIDSPGGEIETGLDFIRYVKQYKNIDTITIFAASMASAIVEALPGRRYVVEDGVLMFHRARGGFQGQFEDGEVESRLNLAKSMVRGMEKVNASRMGISLTEYKFLVKDELWIHDAKNVEMNAADAMVEVKCSPELVDSKETLEVQFMIFTIQLEFSKCPLLRAGNGKNKKDSAFIIKNQKEMKEKYPTLKELH